MMVSTTRPFGLGARRPHQFDVREIAYSLRYTPGAANLNQDATLDPKMLPPIDDQGQEGSCVPHALGKALEYLDLADAKAGSYTKLSRAWMYWAARKRHDDLNPGAGWEQADTGAVPGEACDAVLAGAPKESLWPYPEPVNAAPPASVSADAPNQPWEGSHQPIYVTQAPAEGVWTALSQGFPVIVGIAFPDEWFSPVNGFFPDQATPPDQIQDGHELLIWGRRADGVYLIMNSWGERWNPGASKADPRLRPGMVAVREATLWKYTWDLRAINPNPAIIPPAPQPQPAPVSVRDQCAQIAERVAQVFASRKNQDAWGGAESAKLALQQYLPATATEVDCLGMAWYAYTYYRSQKMTGQATGCAAVWWQIRHDLPLPSGMQPGPEPPEEALAS